MKRTAIFFFLFALASHPALSEIGPWSGHSFRLGMGGALDFEINLKDPKPDPKGDGNPSSAMLRYGYEYGHQFKNTGFYLSGELDWTITYPRNFFSKSGVYKFSQPPISLWYVPMTNVQIGWAFNENWLATIGMVFYWAISNSVRYRPTEHFFFEFASVVWMDRIFNTGGAYGGGFDNLHLTMGFGYKI